MVRTAVVLAALLVAASPAAADLGTSTTAAALDPDGAVVKLTTGWGKGAAAKLRVGSAKATTLHEGAAAGAIAVGHDKTVVALAVDGEGDAFQVVVLAGGKRGAPVAIARAGDRRDIPFAVAATATPDGFTVFFQETQSDDPSAAHTYMARLDADGVPAGDAVEVQVPWSLAAAVWNGTGYHLALFYTESTGMRLSMVTLTAEGQPEQHPDWASGAGFIADVHLIAADGKVRALYRGGGGGDRLLESDVTTVGSWGSEPAKAKDRGKLKLEQTFATTAAGAVKRIK